MNPTSIIKVVSMAFTVLIWLVIIRCILSFVRHNPYQPLIRFVYDVTEPIMAPFRKLIPATGGLDFSPIVVLLVLSLVQSIIIRILLSIL